MKTVRRLSLVASIATAAMLLAMSGQALAVTKTISASVGPVDLPNVPAELCIDQECKAPRSYKVSPSRSPQR